MGPINKEFITPEDLRASAAAAEAKAAAFRANGFLSAADTLLSTALGKRRYADRLEEEAADLLENADFLEAKRQPFAPSTTGNPYGELRA